MHRARFADEARAKLVENGIDADKSAPKALRVSGIVGIVDAVFVKANGTGNFDRHGPDFYAHAERSERVHELAIKIGHGARREGQSAQRAIADFNFEDVLQEVELNFKRAFAIG